MSLFGVLLKYTAFPSTFRASGDQAAQDRNGTPKKNLQTAATSKRKQGTIPIGQLPPRKKQREEEPNPIVTPDSSQPQAPRKGLEKDAAHALLELSRSHPYTPLVAIPSPPDLAEQHQPRPDSDAAASLPSPLSDPMTQPAEPSIELSLASLEKSIGGHNVIIVNDVAFYKGDLAICKYHMLNLLLQRPDLAKRPLLYSQLTDSTFNLLKTTRIKLKHGVRYNQTRQRQLQQADSIRLALS